MTMAQMTAESYAPRSVSKSFGLMRHTFATMIIAVATLASLTTCRTVARYLGHSNVAMTLNTYAEVDPDAKRAALGKIGETFDAGLDGVFADELEAPALTFEFTLEQLEAMLVQAKRGEATSV